MTSLAEPITGPLLGRYTIESGLPTWRPAEQRQLVRDDDGKRHLAYVFPFIAAQPTPEERFFWRRELRSQYALAAQIGTGQQVSVLVDDGIDEERGAFVAIGGLGPLADRPLVPLAEILHPGGRRTSQLDVALPARAMRWRFVRAVAERLDELHLHNMVYRGFGPADVLVSGDDPWRVFVMAGLVWTWRRHDVQSSAQGFWPISPQHRWEDTQDWLDLGVLATRSLVPLTVPTLLSRPSALEALDDGINSVNLAPVERELLNLMLADSATSEARDPVVLLSRLSDLADSGPAARSRLERRRQLAVVVTFRRGSADEPSLAEQMAAQSWVPDPSDPARPYDPGSPADRQALVSAIADDLRSGPKLELGRIEGGDQHYALHGERFVYELRRDREATVHPPWSYAFIDRLATRVRRLGHNPSRRLPVDAIRIMITRDAVPEKQSAGSSPLSWEPFLPQAPPNEMGDNAVRSLIDAVRLINQLDLLQAEEQIHSYDQVSFRVEGKRQEVVIRGTGTRVQEAAPADDPHEELLRYLDGEKRRLAGGEELRVILEGQDGGRLDRHPSSPDLDWRILGRDWRGLVLERNLANFDGSDEPPERYLRTSNLHGQLTLVHRRTEGIARLRDSSELMQLFLSPPSVPAGPHLTTATTTLDVDGVDDPSALNDVQARELARIGRVDGIYLLQGPPGTGKTRMVARHILDVLRSDPAVRILVSAQAHVAVDNTKLRVDALAPKLQASPPLSVRLRPEAARSDGADPATSTGAASPRLVAQDLLEHSLLAAGRAPPRTMTGARWQQRLPSLIAEVRSSDPSRSLGFVELVKRSASVVYATASDRDLVGVDREQGLFDWVLIEESGRAHLFDFVLPMQLGRRHVLIGDHNQLPPFRIADFRRQLGRLTAETREQVVRLLSDGTAGRYLDRDLAERLKAMGTDELQAMSELAAAWLEPFKKIFGPGGDYTAGGVRPVGKLTTQYRMHPVIGALVSDTYYEGTIEHGTAVAGIHVPPRGVARVSHDIVDLGGFPIVWLDLPWAANGSAAAERPTWHNPAEVEAVTTFVRGLRRTGQRPDDLTVAVLSPYAQQVDKLDRALRQGSDNGSSAFPEGFIGRAALGRGNRSAHTVDSFQGDEADVVVISMVRNNTSAPGEGLGFLREAQRMNVLLSRARSLLVLVGSFDFFQYQVTEAERRNVAMFQWSTLITTLAGWFTTGWARRVTAPSPRRW